MSYSEWLRRFYAASKSDRKTSYGLSTYYISGAKPERVARIMSK